MSDDNFVKKQQFADDEVNARYVGMTSASVGEQNAKIEAENARIRAENERAKQDAARRNAEQQSARNALAARAAALQSQLPK